MRLESIEFITRRNGHFSFRGYKIPAVRPGTGVGVGAVFKPSALDEDFRNALGPEAYLWCPSAKELENIMKALDKSDSMTFDILKTSWEGVRPRPLKVADFI